MELTNDLVKVALEYLKPYNIRRLRKACVSSNSQQLEAIDCYGNTALLKACFLGNLEAVRILLAFNANLHAINFFGQNALTLATYAGCLDTVCELLKYRSYVDFALSSMTPPLCLAVLKGHRNLVDLFMHLHPDESSFQTVHGLSAGELQEMQNIERRVH